MPSEGTTGRAGDRLPDAPDLQTQLEALFHTVWTAEAEWRREDRIDMAVRLQRET
jgi:hypothetical protein